MYSRSDSFRCVELKHLKQRYANQFFSNRYFHILANTLLVLLMRKECVHIQRESAKSKINAKNGQQAKCCLQLK